MALCNLPLYRQKWIQASLREHHEYFDFCRSLLTPNKFSHRIGYVTSFRFLFGNSLWLCWFRINLFRLWRVMSFLLITWLHETFQLELLSHYKKGIQMFLVNICALHSRGSQPWPQGLLNSGPSCRSWDVNAFSSSEGSGRIGWKRPG